MHTIRRLFAPIFPMLICVVTTNCAMGAELNCIGTTKIQDIRNELQERTAVAVMAGFKPPMPKLLNHERTLREGTACRSASLSGSLASGDAKYLDDFFDKNPYLQRIYLHDVTGDAEEAMRIGRTLHRQYIGTTAPLSADSDLTHAVLMPHDIHTMKNVCEQDASCVCTEACALIWVGGTVRRGNVVRLDAATMGSTKSYLAEMDFEPRDLDLTRSDGRAMYAIFGHVRYPRPVFDKILNRCGDEPHANTLEPSQLATPGVVKPAYRAQLERVDQGWRACTDLVTFREPS